jgi:predicted MFS family arabinose efflux permease
VSNALYRYSPPFVAVIARGLDVTVVQVGTALMVAEFASLLAPMIGRRIDKANRVAVMALGMSLVIAGTAIAASSPHIVIFTLGVFVLNAAKVIYDTGLIVWVNDHVPYERRGSVVGVIETSWALGLFLGVSSMGLVTSLVSWRAGLSVGAVAMAVSLATIVTGLPRHEAHPPAREHVSVRIPREGWFVVAAMFFLLGASQCVGIVFGPWFEDEFGWTSGVLVAIVVALGAVELFASIGSSRVMDVWGKERSVRRGCAVMGASAVVMAFGATTPMPAVAGLVVFMLGFEFAIVSLLPVAANIVPGASGAGLGMAVGAGTSGRAVLSFVAPFLYDRVGPVAPAVLALAMAGVAAALVTAHQRARHTTRV